MAASHTQLPLTSSHVCNTSDLKRQTGSIPGQLEYTGRVIPTDHLPDFKCGESPWWRESRQEGGSCRSAMRLKLFSCRGTVV